MIKYRISRITVGKTYVGFPDELSMRKAYDLLSKGKFKSFEVEYESTNRYHLYLVLLNKVYYTDFDRAKELERALSNG